MPEAISPSESAHALPRRIVLTDDSIEVTPNTRSLYQELAAAGSVGRAIRSVGARAGNTTRGGRAALMTC